MQVKQIWIWLYNGNFIAIWEIVAIASIAASEARRRRQSCWSLQKSGMLLS